MDAETEKRKPVRFSKNKKKNWGKERGLNFSIKK